MSSLKKLYVSAIFYSMITIFYEFLNKQTTKIDVLYHYSSANPTHIYVLVLGMVMYLVALIFTKAFNLDRLRTFNTWLFSFNISTFSLLFMVMLSDYFVQKNIAFSRYDILVTGLHGILLISVIWFAVMVEKSIKFAYKQNSKS